jgi:hypothetical protein
MTTYVHLFSADMDCCGKTLLAVVATRKRCSSAFWRNPTANTACGRVLRWHHSFPAAYLRLFAVKKSGSIHQWQSVYISGYPCFAIFATLV